MPIIESLLDTDFYKFTMGYLAYILYPNVSVKYAFRNRTTKVRLADVIDEGRLREELDYIMILRFQDNELDYLASIKRADGRPLFTPNFLGFLKGVSLPEYHLETRDGQFVLEFSGPWATAIYWETLALSIINELYYCAQEDVDIRDVVAVGTDNLNGKIRLLSARPDIKFSDFGTRRRFSRIWQEFVIWKLKEELQNNFVGTSNVALAKRFGLKPIGTMAHEEDMVYSGIFHGSDDEIRASHNKVLQDWQSVYAPDLLIALTDTYGSDFFFRDMTRDQTDCWTGLRHDSGDPIEFGEKAIKFYESHGVDPRQKVLVFS
ncbi:nicotinate phosphoribosyltransferase, partial [Patescibacteria group bacterium]|nr:nicotinate phosphoribosyltransferase [Patescibacteria group bacterium]